METDQDLLTRFVNAADDRAFSALVERHVHMVYATARRCCPQEADDVVQAVFLLLSTKAHTLTRASNLVGWLHRTTCYASANARKLGARRRRHELEAAMRMTTRSIPRDDVSAKLTRDDLLETLDDAFRHLPAASRDVVLLRYLEGRTVEETGLLLGISADAAGKRATRGLVKLRALLAQRGAAVPVVTLAGVLVLEGATRVPAAWVPTLGISTASPHAQTLAALTSQAMAPVGKGFVGAVVGGVLLVALCTTAGVVMIGNRDAFPEKSPPPTSQLAARTGPVAGVQQIDESTLPGTNILTHFDVLLDAAAVDTLHTATPVTVDLPGGFFVIRRGPTENVLDALRLAYDNKLVRVSDRQMNHGYDPTRLPTRGVDPFHFLKAMAGRASVTAPQPRTMQLHIPQFWDDFGLGTQRFTVGLTWTTEGQAATFTPTADGVDIQLREDNITASLQEYSIEPPALMNATGSIDFTGTVKPGEAVVLFHDFGPIRGRQFFSASVFHVYRATDAQRELSRHVRDATSWVRYGPAGVRLRADRAAAWAENESEGSPDANSRWTRALDHGVTVRLLAIGRPSVWPFCWWDGDGKPTAGDWTELGLPLTSPQAMAFRIDQPTQPNHADVHWDEPTRAVVVPPEDTQITVWVGNGPWNEKTIAVGDEMRFTSGVVRLKQISDLSNSFSLGTLEGSLGPDVEVWLDAVLRDGKRVEAHDSGRDVVIVTSQTKPWQGRTENLSVSAKAVDHYLLRWRERKPAVFQEFAQTPLSKPPALSKP